MILHSLGFLCLLLVSLPAWAQEDPGEIVPDDLSEAKEPEALPAPATEPPPSDDQAVVPEGVQSTDDPTQAPLTAEAEAIPEEAKDGWHFRFNPSSTLAVSDSRNVVGQPDGYTLIFGLNVDTQVQMLRGPHEWRSSLLIMEAIARTPVIKQFIITTDTFKLDSAYLYSLVSWFGFYGRLALDSNLFPGYDARTDHVTYAIKRKDGSVYHTYDDRLKLTDSFQPVTLKEGLGPFFRPLRKEHVNLEFLLGLGFWQSFADGALTLADDEATPEVEVNPLENVMQIGGESLTKLWGELWEKRIAYLAAVELMMPFYVDPEPENKLEGIDRLNVDILARLTFRLTEWFGVAYEFKAVREPQLEKDFQIQNNMLLVLNYSLYEYIP